jgi:hypothetical protein
MLTVGRFRLFVAERVVDELEDRVRIAREHDLDVKRPRTTSSKPMENIRPRTTKELSKDYTKAILAQPGAAWLYSRRAASYEGFYSSRRRFFAARGSG